MTQWDAKPDCPMTIRLSAHQPCLTRDRRLAKRSRSRRLSHLLRMPSTASSSRYQAGMRTPCRIRASGITLRKLIRSRSVVVETLWGTERGQSHRPQPMLAAPARQHVTHFESSLARLACFLGVVSFWSAHPTCLPPIRPVMICGHSTIVAWIDGVSLNLDRIGLHSK